MGMSDSLEQELIAETTALPTTARPRQRQRWILLLLALGLGSTLLLTTLAGNARTFALLLNANLSFVTVVALVQALRYVAMSISTRVVAEIVGMRVALFKLFQVTVAAQAANRTFVGGAAGLMIRMDFFLRREMRAGTFLAVETVEDVVSLLAISLMFCTGLFLVLTRGVNVLRLDVISAVIAGALALAAGALTLVRHRDWVERLADGVVRGFDWLVARLLRRHVYDPVRVQRGVADFYAALELARRDPLRVFISFLCALGRLGCDAVALYFAFRAVGYQAAPGIVLFIFVVSSSVSTIAAVPGQIGVLEGTLAFMSTLLGVPPPAAVGATLVYRLVSFWLPIPFGYLFAWQLERRGEL